MSISWSAFGNAIINNAKAKRLPLVGQFELTSRCNLSCKMCYVCNKSDVKEVMAQEKSADDWIKLARQVRDAGVLYVLLTGGEVFIRTDFKKIYEALSEMGFSIQIYSNATMITPEIANWLGKKPPSKVSVTMYGASAETYKRITGSSEAYSKAVQGIDLLKNEGIIVALRTTIVKGNRIDAKSIFDFAYERNIVCGLNQYISPRREGLETDPLAERLSPKETWEYNQEITSYIKERTSRDEKKQKLVRHLDVDSIVESTDSSHPESAFSCTAGHCSFWVTWDGRMTPCGMMAEPMIDIFDMDFNSGWKRLKEKCDDIPKALVCEGCETLGYCLKCPAKLKLETGNYMKCPDYLKELSLLSKMT